MKRQFNDYLKVILQHEGGSKITENPKDPGGLTKYGISARSYPGLNIRELTLAEASSIYYHDYWAKLRIDNITDELLKLHIFDMAVNAGIKPSIKLLQGILGVTMDGVIGLNTEAKIGQFEGDLVEEYKKERIQYYNNLVSKNAKLKTFLKGWINRVNNTKFN